MPTTSTPQAERLRRDLATLTGLATSDLLRVFSTVDSTAAAQAALNDLLPSLMSLYGSAASTLAADWYDDLRDESEVPRRFRAIPAPLPDSLGTAELVGWAYAKSTAEESVESLVSGGMTRRVLNQSRATITGSAIQDPSATGWQRVGSGECGFCQMLIGRGAVYTQATANFASHDHCKCSAVPAFGGRPAPVKPYTPSQKKASDADRARVREYLRNQ